MDKSESELLAEWDLVSSLYDTEQESSTADKKDDKQPEKSENDDIDPNGNSESQAEAGVKKTECEGITKEPVTTDTEENIQNVISEKSTEIDSSPESRTEVIVLEQSVNAEAVQKEVPKIGDGKQDIAANIVIDETSDAETHLERDVGLRNEKSPERQLEKDITDSQKAADQSIETNDDITSEIKDTGTPDYIDVENNVKAASDQNIDINIQSASVEYNEDHALNSSLDSSIEHIQDLPELVDLNEQEIAAIESSSSDIDIIDENMEESTTSSFIYPPALSISSSVDTSSSLNTPSESSMRENLEKKPEDVSISEKTESHIEKSSSSPSSSVSYSGSSQQSKFKDRSENVQPEPRRPQTRNFLSDVCTGILQFTRNMSFFEWSILGGVMVCLYVTVIFNQTNIFAVVEKEDVVSQMKTMIDELKNDNKILKDQMLSEMKNEKVFSSFEHQIKELRKENSKLNHMLYDVAKVLEEQQKDTNKRYEKKESEYYVAPFKKEINKLKEHINILKFDNEELQKQLVRMRYSSYSQGKRDDSEDKTKEQKEKAKMDETPGAEDTPLDINTLKKWNELISLLSKELGVSENEPLEKDIPHSDRRNLSFYWKFFLKEFKGTFKDFKADVTSKWSFYKRANEEALFKVFKFVKNFFTVEEKEKFVPTGEEKSQWKNIGDFVNDLGERWTNIKDRIYSSDLKKILMDFKKSGQANDQSSDETDKRKYDYKEQKPTNVHFESDGKHEKIQVNPEDSKWMFKRAELRAELRDTEGDDDESSENWFLKRKRPSEDDSDKSKF